MLWGITAFWFAVALVAILTGQLTFSADGLPTGMAIALLVPIALFGALYFGSDRFRSGVLSLNPRLVVLSHSFRVVGAVFLALWAFGELPALFALPAGLGDIAVALYAPFIASRVLPRVNERRGAFVAWNALGIFDLALAVTLGILHSPGPLGLLKGAVTTGIMAEFPMALIPGFLVPLFIILHLVSLAQASAGRMVEARPALQSQT